jgi:hypothetical protein
VIPSVPRPAIIEELGLKLLLEEEGVGVEFSREKYEDGDWGSAVEEAWTKGAEMKERRRREGNRGVERRKQEGEAMAKSLVKWVEEYRSRRTEECE